MTGPGANRHFSPLGRPVSRLGLGTVAFRVDRRDAAFAVLDAWVETGGTLVDTAAVYNAGGSERVLGAWMADRGARDRVVLLTKGAHPDAEWRSRMRPDAIASDLEESLDRLGTDRVDIWMLHRDDPAVPVGEIVDALDAPARSGRVRTLGASNWTPERLEAAAAHAEAHGRTPFTSSSVYLGLAEPAQPYTPGCTDAWDRTTRTWYTDNAERWPLFAWSAQAGGFFADNFDPRRAAVEAVAAWDTEPNRARRERARELGRRRGVTTAQVALAWVLSQPFRPFAMVGLRDRDHVRAAWAALDVELEPAEREWLETGEDGAG